MTPRRPLAAALAAGFLTFGAVSAEEPAEEPAALALDDYQIIQYVASRGFSPEALIRLDSNGEILIACLEPMTKAELEAAGVSFIDSQLVLLNTMGMLSLADGKIETTLPFFGAERSERLRAATRAAASTIGDAVAGEAATLRAALDQQGSGGQAYAVFFSYVLDGMVWDFFEEYAEVRPRRLTVSQPHWAGEIWGIYPPRSMSVGTSSLASGSLVLKVGRSSHADEMLQPLVSSWRELRQWLEQIDQKESTVEVDLAAKLTEYGLLDEAGGIAVAVVREEPGDPVFEAAQRLTEKLVDRVLEDLPLSELTADLDLRSRQQTLIIAYHELMWDLLEKFERDGLVERPRLLREEEGRTRADAAEMVFLVKRPVAERPPRQDPQTSRDDEEE